MRYTVSLLFVAAVVACAPAEKAADTSTVAQAATPAPIKISDVAGKWNVNTLNDKDSVIVRFVLTAKDSTWASLDEGRKTPEMEHVIAVAGDSIVTKSDVFDSVLRKGVKVWTQIVHRLSNGKLVGRITAHYNVKTADSVRTFRFEGTRAQ